MKKKIALLLALIMTISLMPITVFAASDNRLTRTYTNIPRRVATIFGATTRYSTTMNRSYSQLDANRKQVEYAEEAQYLALTVTNSSSYGSIGDSFRLQLTEAVWAAWLVNNSELTTRGDNVAFGTSGLNTLSTVSASSAFGVGTATDLGYYFSSNDWFSYTYDPNADGANGGDVLGLGDIGYTLRISSIDQTVAEVIINQTYGPGSNTRLMIPLTIVIPDNDKEVTLSMTANNSVFTMSSFVLASTSDSGTVNTAKTIKSGRDRIALDTILFTEKRLNSIKANGVFEIIAPSGYEFNDPSNWTFSVDLGLTLGGAANTVIKAGGTSLAASADVKWYDTTSRYSRNDNRESYYIYINGFDSNRVRSGALAIDGIVLLPIDGVVNSGTDLQISISTYSSIETHATSIATSAGFATLGFTGATNLGISDVSFNVAKSVDWAIELTAATPKDLIAGRWDANRLEESPLHTTARVTFKELEIGAWLSERNTTFVLPDGVQVRGIKFTGDSNIARNGSYTTDNEKYLVDAKSPSAATALEQQGDLTRYVYTDYATYYGNTFTLRNIPQNNTKMRSFTFELYLSISPDFEGDEITIDVEGTGIPSDMDITPVVIANVIKPIDVEFKTTSVQIGFQRYSVADIKVTENIAGALLRGEYLNLIMDDYYSYTDIQFAPITDSQVTLNSGDIKLSTIKNNDGEIQFVIDRASTVASTFTISGVEIRINRSVPYGTYDLVAYGDAVFQNYAYANSSEVTLKAPSKSTITGFGKWNQGFKFANYISVDTEGSNIAFKNTVQLSAGSNTILVNNDEVIEMDVTAVVLDDGNMYLPFRYLAYAFGVAENEVLWDQESATATIMTASRSVKATRGSTTIQVAGAGSAYAPTTLVDAAGNPVAPLIVNDRFLLPLRALCNAFGIDNSAIVWDDATKTVTINPSNR